MQASLFSWGHLLKIISSSLVTSQLPEAMITTGANKELRKVLKEKLGHELSTEGFEKLWHIPGNLKGHSHVQGCAHSQRRPGKALSSHL